jgi:hypothetical protein
VVTCSRWLADEQDRAVVVEAHVEHVAVGPVRQRCASPGISANHRAEGSPRIRRRQRG